jgi:hypothetical protein
MLEAIPFIILLLGAAWYLSGVQKKTKSDMEKTQPETLGFTEQERLEGFREVYRRVFKREPSPHVTTNELKFRLTHKLNNDNISKKNTRIS